MKKIFAKLFLGNLIATFAVLVMMSSIFVIAIKTSISHWNRDEATDIINLLSPVISKVYRLTGTLEPSTLEAAVLPYTTDSLYVYIFDVNKKPILLLNKGQHISQRKVEEQLGSLNSFLSLNVPATIKDNDKIICYLSVNSQEIGRAHV